VPWTVRKTNKWILEKAKYPEIKKKQEVEIFWLQYEAQLLLKMTYHIFSLQAVVFFPLYNIILQHSLRQNLNMSKLK